MGELRLVRGTALSFPDAEELLQRLKHLLAKHRIDVTPGSKVAEICGGLTEFLEFQRGKKRVPEKPEETDRRDAWLRMFSLVDLAIKVLDASETQLFAKLAPHLRFFNSATVDPSQNAPTKPGDEDADRNHKLFELLIGAACVTFADDLWLESPTERSSNPDLIVLSDRQRWGIACKVIHSQRPETYRDRVLDGIKQIDNSGDRHADAQRGIVLINVKSLLPVETFLPFGEKSKTQPYEVFETDAPIEARLHKFGAELFERLGENAWNLANGFQRSRAVPIVANYLQGLTLKRVDGQVRFAPFAMICVSNFATGALDEEAATFLDKLRYAVHWGSRGPPNSTTTEQLKPAK